jgi:hypothetical protein
MMGSQAQTTPPPRDFETEGLSKRLTRGDLGAANINKRLNTGSTMTTGTEPYFSR